MVGCVQDVVGRKKFLVQFEDDQKRDISASLLSYICEKKQVVQEVHETIYDLPQRVQGELLIINGDPFCEGYNMF